MDVVGRLTAARIFASGTGDGASTFTPDPPPGTFPLKWAMILSTDRAARDVAPQGVMDSGADDYVSPE